MLYVYVNNFIELFNRLRVKIISQVHILNVGTFISLRSATLFYTGGLLHIFLVFTTTPRRRLTKMATHVVERWFADALFFVFTYCFALNFVLLLRLFNWPMTNFRFFSPMVLTLRFYGVLHCTTHANYYILHVTVFFFFFIKSKNSTNTMDHPR